MKIICIEEHSLDIQAGQLAMPVLMREAPYIAFNSTENVVRPRNPDRPTFRSVKEASALAQDLRASRIKAMDDAGIDMQIVSCATPVQIVPVDDAVALIRGANDRLAEAVAAYPARLRAFALLPWQDPQAAADELSRAVTELGMVGVLISGRPGGTFLDDPRYDAVLRRLHDLKVPLYVHPMYVVPAVHRAYYEGFSPEVTAQFSLAGWGWHHEAGVHLLRLLLSGVTERYPDIQLIVGHWGEMVPFYLSRLDDLLPPKITGLSRELSETFKSNVWVSPSGMFDLPHFEFIYSVLGADRIMWSLDYPFVTTDGTRKFLEELPITDNEKRKIAYGNAETLFRL